MLCALVAPGLSCAGHAGCESPARPDRWRFSFADMSAAASRACSSCVRAADGTAACSQCERALCGRCVRSCSGCGALACALCVLVE